MIRASVRAFIGAFDEAVHLYIGGDVRRAQSPPEVLVYSLLNPNTMEQRELTYRVFIVRCWVEETPDDVQAIVRYTLDVPATGDRCGFITCQELLEALQTELTSVLSTNAFLNAAAQQEPKKQKRGGSCSLSSIP